MEKVFLLSMPNNSIRFENLFNLTGGCDILNSFKSFHTIVFWVVCADIPEIFFFKNVWNNNDKVRKIMTNGKTNQMDSFFWLYYWESFVVEGTFASYGFCSSCILHNLPLSQSPHPTANNKTACNIYCTKMHTQTTYVNILCYLMFHFIEPSWHSHAFYVILYVIHLA